jgi:DNA-directed RNA polymerase subunit RPC12/RpoP
MGSGAIKWHVHCSVCGAFIEKSAQSDSEVECRKCRSTLEILVKDDMVSVRPLVVRDEQLKSRMRSYSRMMMNPGKDKKEKE